MYQSLHSSLSVDELLYQHGLIVENPVVTVLPDEPRHQNSRCVEAPPAHFGEGLTCNAEDQARSKHRGR